MGFDIFNRRNKKKIEQKDCDGPVTIRHKLPNFVMDCDGSITNPDNFLFVTNFSVTILKYSVAIWNSPASSSQPFKHHHNFRHKL